MEYERDYEREYQPTFSKGLDGWVWWRLPFAPADCNDLKPDTFERLVGGKRGVSGELPFVVYPTRDAAVAALDAARAKAGGGNAIAVELLAALRSAAAEIRDRHGSLEEQNWVPEFHLDLTLTVAECRVILAAVARAES